MPELKDYQALIAQRKFTQRPVNVMTLREPRLADVTHKAQTVIDHPGWQYFLDALESRVKTLSTERDAIARRMVSGDELGQELERLKIRLNRIDAEMTGLRYAASLIPQAVEFGQQIASGVTGQAAAASIAGSRA